MFNRGCITLRTGPQSLYYQRHLLYLIYAWNSHIDCQQKMLEDILKYPWIVRICLENIPKYIFGIRAYSGSTSSSSTSFFSSIFRSIEDDIEGGDWGETDDFAEKRHSNKVRAEQNRRDHTQEVQSHQHRLQTQLNIKLVMQLKGNLLLQLMLRMFKATSINSKPNCTSNWSCN